MPSKDNEDIVVGGTLKKHEERLARIERYAKDDDVKALAAIQAFSLLQNKAASAQMDEINDTLEALPESIGVIVEEKLKNHGNGSSNGVVLTAIKKIKFFKWEFIGYSWFEVIMIVGVLMVFGLVLQEVGVIDGCTGFMHRLLGHGSHK